MHLITQSIILLGFEEPLSCSVYNLFLPITKTSMRQIYFIKVAGGSMQHMHFFPMFCLPSLHVRELPQFTDSWLPLTRSFFRVIRLSLYGLLLNLTAIYTVRNRNREIVRCKQHGQGQGNIVIVCSQRVQSNCML